MPKGGNRQPSIDNAEHTDPEESGENVAAKRVVLYGWDYTNLQWVRVAVDASGILQTSGSGGSTDGAFDFMDGNDAAFMDGADMAFMSG